MDSTFRHAQPLGLLNQGAIFLDPAGAAEDIVRQTLTLSRRGMIEVRIGEAIQPKGEGWEDAVALRDHVRALILADCGEVDLTSIGR